MELYTILGIGLVSTVMYILIKQYKPEYAILIALVSTILIMVEIFVSLQYVIDELNGFITSMSINEDYIKILLKSLGICYVIDLASETCKDAGLTSLASKIELAGKVMIILIAMPIFESLLNIAISLMSQ